MKRKIALTFLALIILAGNSYFSYRYGRIKGEAEGISRTLISVNSKDKQVQLIMKALKNSPYLRVCAINAKYRALLKKMNIDPEKYGVTE
jgi:hypothetical protein